MGQLPWEVVERKVVVKVDEPTSPGCGCSPRERAIPELLEKGVTNLNKPDGPTSHMCAEYVKRVLKLRKAGHGGTLDPGVTGVLPVCTPAATRIAQYLLKAGKEYVVRMRTHKDVEEPVLRRIVEKFQGEITQLPPVKSAVKRVMRQRNIYYLELNQIQGKDVLMTVGCQAGTYIRKLVHDMGEQIGGAHMAELVRTKAGPFLLQDSVTLQELEDAYALWTEEQDERLMRKCVLPMEEGVRHLPKVWVRDSAVDALAHGATLKVPGIARLHNTILKGDLVAVMTLKDELVAVGMAAMSHVQMMTEQRGVAVRSDSVFMKPGVYPR